MVNTLEDIKKGKFDKNLLKTFVNNINTQEKLVLMDMLLADENVKKAVVDSITRDIDNIT